MNFEIWYDLKNTLCELPIDGKIKIETNPFNLEYEYSANKIQKISPFESEKQNLIISGKLHSKKPLSSIDGVVCRDEFLQIDVKEGIIYLQDKPISEYFSYFE